MSERDCTLSDAREALGFISADERETWVQMAMAVKSEFGADGFDVWSDWSQTSTSFSPSAARDVWKSVKAAGGIGIGTLFQRAIANGYQFAPRTEADKTRLAQEAAARRERVAAQLAKEAAIHAEKVRTCAARAAKIFNSLPDSGASPYLDRKKVGAYGVRFSRGSVVVPVCTVDGELVGLQFIAPDGDKKFLTGTPKSGCCHVVGEPDALAKTLWIAEGYATAATVHMATGNACVVAFDAGNLVPVAKALRAKYPDWSMLFAADNDTETPSNPGVTKAREAALAVGGLVWVPVWPEAA